MRHFLMTIGCGLVLFGTTVVASAQEKQAPAETAVQAPTQKAVQAPVQAPVQKGAEQAPVQKGAVQAPVQKATPVQKVTPVQKHVQAPTQKHVQHVQKPTQKPVQKGDCCERTRRFGRRCC